MKGRPTSTNQSEPFKYIPFCDIPSYINDAAEKLDIFHQMRGMRYWQFGPVAARRLVNELERQRDELLEMCLLAESRITYHAPLDASIDKIRAAIAAVKGDRPCSTPDPVPPKPGDL